VWLALFTLTLSPFVRFLRAGVQPTLDPSAETFWISPMRQPRERRRADKCVWCERYVKEGKYAWAACQVFLNAPPLGLAYCLTKPGLALVQRQPWPVHGSAPGPDWHLFSASPTGLPFSTRPPDWHFCSISQETWSRLSASALTSARLTHWRC